MKLEQAFEEAMIGIYRRASDECQYHPTRFLQMINERGAVSTAKHLLNGPRVSDGFVTLWQLGRLDLAVEALVIREPWRQLFSSDELALATERLVQAGYRVDVI